MKVFCRKKSGLKNCGIVTEDISVFSFIFLTLNNIGLSVSKNLVLKPGFFKKTLKFENRFLVENIDFQYSYNN